MRLLRGLLLLLLLVPLVNGRGQGRPHPLPEIIRFRRADTPYLDSLSGVLRQQYQTLNQQPRTAGNDTLRLRTLHQLGRLYRLWASRRDSTLFFGNELINQARQRQNLLYEINGKLILAEYYSSGDRDTPRAFRLNLNLLKRLPPKNAFYDVPRYRVNMNLAALYSLAKDFTSGFYYLRQARQLLTTDLRHAGPEVSNTFRTEVEQSLGSLYQQQDNFPESERHYLASESLLTPASTEAGRAFIYDDLAELYLKYHRFGQALPFAKKAEAIWTRLRTPTESKSWGTLACVYAGLGQNDLAFQYAQNVLQLPKPSKFTLEQAYHALYQVYERRNDWKNGAFYYKKYIGMRDIIAHDQRSLELAGIQKQTEFATIELDNQRKGLLAKQRLLTFQQQAELSRIRAKATTDSLTRRAELTEQRRHFDNERDRILLDQQQVAQEIRQQAFDLRGVLQKNQAQQTLILYLTSSFLFILGILLLLLYLARIRKRQAEAELRFTLERKEANTRIIQTQEAERARIAADLHDDLGGTLATLHQHLSEMRQQTTDTDTQRAFDEADPLIQKSSDDLRRIAHNLMPPEFERIGLNSALEQLVRSQPRQPTRFTFIVSGSQQTLPLDAALNSYRIVSELIQNISRHAQASQASVQLFYHNDRLTIMVDDNGLGSRALPNPNKSAGIGLKNSSLRAEYIGATLWREASEAGTLVVLDVPYPTPSHAARNRIPHSAD